MNRIYLTHLSVNCVFKYDVLFSKVTPLSCLTAYTANQLFTDVVCLRQVDLNLGNNKQALHVYDSKCLSISKSFYCRPLTDFDPDQFRTWDVHSFGSTEIEC